MSNTILAVIKSAPLVKINPKDTTISAGKRVHFTTEVIGTIANYAWMPADQLQTPTSLNPSTIDLMNKVEYSLMLEGANGCRVESKAIVQVIKQFYMPNTFTPNGDGVNDVFRIPPGVALDLKVFSVYDRWGNKIFTTKNINQGWAGTLKGIPLSTGNYVYIIEAIDTKGALLLKGNVILVR